MIFFVLASSSVLSFLCLLSSLLCTTVKQLLRRYNFVSHPISHDSIFVPSYLPVIPATKSHPATRFYCPPQSKNVVFIPKITLFTDFCPFFARKTVKNEPISKWFSFSNSSRPALQHCRAKFVATQTSLHENNYRNIFRWQMVCVRLLGCFSSKINLDFTRCSCSSNWTIWLHARLSRSKIG